MKLILFVLVNVGILSADCVERALTAAEEAFAVKVGAALDAAIPAAPPGWTMAPLQAPGKARTCSKEIGSFEINRYSNYTWTTPPRETDLPEYAEKKKLEEQMTKASELTPEQNKEVEAIFAEMRAKSKAARDADKAGDKAAAAAARKEADELYAKGDKIKQNQRLAGIQQTEALRKRRDELNRIISDKTRTDVRIELVVNQRFPSEPNPTTEVVLVGPAKAVSAMKAQNVRMYVVGGAAGRRAILQALDKSKLEAVLR